MKSYALVPYPTTPRDEPEMPPCEADACTRCGTKVLLGFARDFLDDDKWSVHCFKCGRTGPSERDFDKAIETWNEWQKQ